MKMKTIALIGAGGKMGCRITDNVKGGPDLVKYLEVNPAGIGRLKERGVEICPPAEALPHADVVLAAFEVLPPLDMSTKALIHGDWHLGQLVHRGAWRLIDVDDIGVGDPVWDLARPAALFAAGVMPDDLWARFLHAYRETGGVALPTSEWEALNIPAQAYVVQMAARALMSGLQAVEPLVEACRRIVATHESSDRG